MCTKISNKQPQAADSLPSTHFMAVGGKWETNEQDVCKGSYSMTGSNEEYRGMRVKYCENITREETMKCESAESTEID